MGDTIGDTIVQRYRRGGQIKPDGRKAAAVRRIPANRLSEDERDEILTTANQSQYADLPPSQIVPLLADEGRYLASESSFYRILHEAKQMTHRGRAKAPKNKRPEPVQATAPNQLWSWDITYLSTTIKGLYFYLYLIMSIVVRLWVGRSMRRNLLNTQPMSFVRLTYAKEWRAKR